jgi:hypothetical protein
MLAGEHTANTLAGVEAGIEAGPREAAAADLQFLSDVIATFGPTIIRMASSRNELNLATMSRILARSLGLAWDAVGREFVQRQPDLTYASIPTDCVVVLLADSLHRIAAQHSDTFPMKELRPARIHKLADAIRMSALWHRPDAQDVVLRFVREGLCLKPGSSVASHELYEAYVLFSTEHRLRVTPRSAFSREVVRAVFKVFAKTPSHRVLRPVNGMTKQTSHYGFKGLVLAGSLGEAGEAGEVRFTNPS